MGTAFIGFEMNMAHDSVSFASGSLSFNFFFAVSKNFQTFSSQYFAVYIKSSRSMFIFNHNSELKKQKPVAIAQLQYLLLRYHESLETFVLMR